MKTLCSLALAALLSLGSTVSAAYAPTPQDRLENRRDQRSDSLTSPIPGATALVAVITDIDRLHGVVSLDTEIGKIVTVAAPEDLQNLHRGDQIVLYVMDEDQRQDQRSGSILT